MFIIGCHHIIAVGKQGFLKEYYSQVEKCFYSCHFLHVQLQNNYSEESFPHSPCILIQCQDLKTISIFCPSVQSGNLHVFSGICPVLPSHNKGNWKYRAVCALHFGRETQDQSEVLELPDFFSSLLLHFLVHCNLNLLNFTVKFCITCNNRYVGTEKGQNLFRLHARRDV